MKPKSGHVSNRIIASSCAATDNQDVVPKTTTNKKKRRMHILRVAMYLLSLRSGKSKSDIVGSKWKNLLSSMRPLHINSNQSTSQAATVPVVVACLKSKEVVDQQSITVPPAASEEFDVFSPPWSPAPQSIGSSSSGQNSQYASAQNLRELDHDDQSDEDDDEEDRYYDDKYGDEMIDMKAEEFIAKFYDQMKLQHI